MINYSNKKQLSLLEKKEIFAPVYSYDFFTEFWAGLAFKILSKSEICEDCDLNMNFNLDYHFFNQCHCVIH